MWHGKLWANWGTLACACVLGLSGACSSQPEFERVEEYPEGMQIDTAKSAFSNKLQTTTVSDRYPAGFDAVWAATKRVAHHFEKLHGKPVMRIDENNRSIELRDIHKVDRSKGYNPDAERIEGWKDEFLIKVVALDSNQTQVTVSRKVVGIPSFRLCGDDLVQCGSLYEPEVSNAKIEEWILTKIEDDLAS
ncbi:MAG: hypothetical protein R3351_05945, partial [Nitrospirales bacterium]|nr:hypothetical protein [Nitrospirales bacterium]